MRVRLVAAGTRAGGQQGDAARRAVPPVCGEQLGGSAAGAGASGAVRTLAESPTHLPRWSSQGAGPGFALRKHTAEIANCAAEA